MARKTMAEIRAQALAEADERYADVMQQLEDKNKFDEQTMFKVYAALSAVGIDIATSTEAVDEMQNRGILFRERM